MTSDDSAADCCFGDPGFGDPHGMHSFDCPVYKASRETLLDRRIKPEPAPWPPKLAAESTSERLRQTQRDLAASQEDLSRMAAKWEAALAEGDALTLRVMSLRADLAEAQKSEPCAWRDLAIAAMQERDLARAQLDDAIATFRAGGGS